MRVCAILRLLRDEISVASRICFYDAGRSLAEGSGFLLLIFAYTPSLMSRDNRLSYQLFMYFFFRPGWQVQFIEADLQAPLPRKVRFADADKISELARRGGASGGSEAKQMLEHAIETRRGGVCLKLTLEQYARLKRS
jgi:hypothetical protein